MRRMYTTFIIILLVINSGYCDDIIKITRIRFGGDVNFYLDENQLVLDATGEAFLDIGGVVLNEKGTYTYPIFENYIPKSLRLKGGIYDSEFKFDGYIGDLYCDINYSKTTDAYSFSGSNDKCSPKLSFAEKYTVNFCDATVNATFELVQPQKPQITITNSKNQHVTPNGDGSYSICECNCNTVFETGYRDTGMEYIWKIYLGNDLEATAIYTSEKLTTHEFSINLNSISELSGLTSPQDISIVVTPSNTRFPTWTFPTSQVLSATVRPQSTFVQQPSGRNVDLYPVFDNSKSFESWGLVYKPGIASTTVNCGVQVGSDLSATAVNWEDKNSAYNNNGNKLYQFVLNRGAGVAGQVEWSFKFQNTVGDTAISQKYCYANTMFNIPITNPSFTFLVDKSSNNTDCSNNTIYLCAGENTVYVRTNMGRSVVISNGTSSTTHSMLYTSADANSATKQISFTPDAGDKTYTIVYTDIAGNSFTRNVTVRRIANPTFSAPSGGLTSQTCGSPANGSARIDISGSGWVFENPVLRDGAVTVANSGSNTQPRYSGLTGEVNYTFSISKLTHSLSGCEYTPAARTMNVRVSRAVIPTDFTFEGGDNQTLACIGGSKSVRLKPASETTFNTQLGAYNGSTAISGSSPWELTGLTYNLQGYSIKVAYKDNSCNDYTLKPLKIIDPASIGVQQPTVQYGATEKKLNFGLTDYTGYSFKLIKTANADGSATNTEIQAISDVTNASLTTVAVTPGRYKGVFTRNGCTATGNTTESAEITVFGNVSLAPINGVVPVSNCARQPVTTNATNGSGNYRVEYRPFSGTTYSVLPAAGLAVGKYVLRCYDNVTHYYSNEITVVVGAESRVSVTAPSSVDVMCNNREASVKLNVTNGASAYSYSLNGASGSFTVFNPQQPIVIPSSTYTGKNNELVFTLKDATGCTATTSKVRVDNPAALQVSITSGNNYVTKCSDLAEVTINAIGGSPGYSYIYKPSGATFEIASSANTILVNTIGNHEFYVRDSKGCISNSVQKEIISEDIKLEIDPASRTRVTAPGAKDALIKLNGSLGTTPYSFLMLNAGETMPANPGWSAAASEFKVGVGSYTFYAKDSKGCLTNVSATVINPFDGINIAASLANNQQCNGSNSGVVSVNLTSSSDMNLSKMILKNISTNQVTERSISGSSYQFTGLAPGSYSLYVKNTAGTESDAKLLSLTEKQDVSVTVNAIDPIYGGETLKKENTTVSFTLTSNGNEINEVQYREPSGQWQLAESGTDIDRYSFSAKRGGSYEIRVRKCGAASNYYSTTANVLQIPKPAFSRLLTQPADNRSMGSITLTNLNSESDIRYSYRIAIRKSGESTLVTREVGSDVKNVTIDNLDQGTYTLNAYSIYNGLQLGDMAQADFTINPQLRVTITNPALYIKVCNGASATYRQVSSFISSNVSATGGTGSYTYKLAAEGTGTEYSLAAALMLPAGRYTVKVADGAGTVAVSGTMLEVREAPGLTMQLHGNTSLLCYESVTNVQLVLSGGWGDYNLISSTPQVDLINQGSYFTGSFGRGTYTFKFRDREGCEVTSAPLIISSPDAPLTLSIDGSSVTDLGCSSGNDGRVVLNAAGGTAGYSYSYTYGSSTEVVGSNVVEKLPTGSYTFNVVDVNGCSATVNSAITTRFIPQNPEYRSVTTPVSCNGGSDGTIVLENASALFDYKLTSGVASDNSKFEGLAAGRYTITRTNKGTDECPADEMVEITEPERLSIADLHTVPSCIGDGKGAVSFKAKGGNGGWYALLGGTVRSDALTDGTISFGNLVANAYTVEVTDSKGCRVSQNVTVGNLPRLDNSTIDRYMEHACSGSKSAMLQLTPADSSRAQSWKLYKEFAGDFLEMNISNKYRKLTVRGLDAALYKSRLTDDETSCIIYDEQVSLRPAVVIKSITPRKIVCKGGKAPVSIDISGTEDPVRYFYRKEQQNTETGFNPATDSLPAGRYILTVRSDYCSAEMSFEVVEPDMPLQLNVEPEVIGEVNGVKYHLACTNGNDGTLNVKTSGGWGGYSLLADNNRVENTGTISGLQRGLHAVRLTDENGCFVEVSQELTAPLKQLSLKEVSKEQVKNGDVVDNSVVLHTDGGIGGYVLTLNMAGMKQTKWVKDELKDVSFSFNGAGNFAFVATDSLGCTDRIEVVLDAHSQLKFTREAVSPICYGGNDGKLLIDEGKPEYRYTLISSAKTSRQQTGNGAFTGLTSGSYTLIATDNVFTEYYNIDITDPQRIGVNSRVDSSCSNSNSGVVTITLSNGVAANSYNVILSDDQGASTSSVIKGNEAALFTGLPSGGFTVNVANINEACKDSDTGISTLTIGRLKSLAYRIAPVHLCNTEGGKVAGDFTVGSHLYTVDLLKRNTEGAWDQVSGFDIGGATDNIAPEVTPGWYRYRTTDKQYGCRELTDSVIVYSSPYIDRVEVTDEVCFGEKGTLKVYSAGGSGNLSIYQGQTDYERIFNNTVHLAPGSYKLLVHDETSGCSVSRPEQAVIDGPTAPLKISFIPKTYNGFNIDCHSATTGVFDVDITGGGVLRSARYGSNTYTDRQLKISGAAAGWHKFIVNDSFGCIVKDSVNLIQPDKVSLTVADSKLQLGCDNSNAGFVKLAATGGTSSYTYAVNSSAFTSSPQFRNLGVAGYLFKVKDTNGCRDSVEVAVETKYIPFDLHLETSNVSCFGAGDGVVRAVPDGTNTFSYRWHSSNSTGSYTDKLTPGTYGVTATTANGCTKDLFAVVTQPEQLSFVLSSKMACPGVVNGSVTFTTQGGTIPYEYFLNDVSFGSTGSNLGIPYGLYVAKVTDANGCTEIQSLQIGKMEGTIAANFLVATTSATSDTLALIDISNPVPDYIKWDLTNNGNPVNQVNEPDSKIPLVKFLNEGSYTLAMTAHYGECAYTISKVVTVKDGVLSEEGKSFVLGANGIKKFDIYPNPSRGQSRYRVEMFEPNDATLYVYDLRGKLLHVEAIPKTSYYEGTLNITGQPAGLYVVRVVLNSKRDYSENKLIIQ